MITIWPHTSQFKVDADSRYQNWLRNDHQREIGYRGALIELSKKFPEAKNILDAGTGSGVWTITAGILFPEAKILGIDSEQKNINLAKENLEGFPTLKPRIDFKKIDINNFRTEDREDRFDIIITELDGGIGGNEGAKRAFLNLRKLLTKKGIIIPQKIEVYIAPVDLENINQVLPNIRGNPFLRKMQINIRNPYFCYYLVYGISPQSLLAKESLFDRITIKGKIIEGNNRRLNYKIARSGFLTGFLIWFKHHLTERVIFTNAPKFPVTSWGQAYFPVKKIKVEKGDQLCLRFAECLTKSGPLPHYQWAFSLNDSDSKLYSNQENQMRRK